MLADDLQTAWAVAVHILSYYPRSAWACRVLAEILAIQGRSYEALQQFTLVVSAYPLDAEAYAAMAVLASDINRQEDAVRYYALATDHQGGYPAELTDLPRSITTSRLGILQERSGLYAHAVDTLAKSVAIDSTRLDLSLLLARCLYLIRLFEDAERAVVAVLSSAPDCLEGNILAASICARSGRGEDATAFRRVAAGLDPTGKTLSQLEPGPIREAAMLRRVPEVPKPRIAIDQYLQSSARREASSSDSVPDQSSSAPSSRSDAYTGINETKSTQQVVVTSQELVRNEEVAPEVTQDLTTAREPERTPTSAIDEEAQPGVEEAAPTESVVPREETPVTAQEDESAWERHVDTSEVAESAPEPSETPPDAQEAGAPWELPVDTDVPSLPWASEEDATSITAEAGVSGQFEVIAEGEPPEAVTEAEETRQESDETDALEEPELASLESVLTTESTSASQTSPAEAYLAPSTPSTSDSEGRPQAHDTGDTFPNFEEWFQQNVLEVVDAQLGSMQTEDEAQVAQSQEIQAYEQPVDVNVGHVSSSESLTDTAPTEQDDEQAAAHEDFMVSATGGDVVTNNGPQSDEPAKESTDVVTAEVEYAVAESVTVRSEENESSLPAASFGPAAGTETDASEPAAAAATNGYGATSSTVASDVLSTSEPSERMPAGSEPLPSKASRSRGRRWTPPRFERRRHDEPIRSALADLAEKVENEPLNNGSRFELAQALEAADPTQAVAQYAIIVGTRDPRLVAQVRQQLEALVASGVSVHGLQRLIGDVCMQQGAFERAIEAYSLAFDELRSRQIIDKRKRHERAAS